MNQAQSNERNTAMTMLIPMAAAVITTICRSAKNSPAGVTRVKPCISYIDKAQAFQSAGVSDKQHRLQPTS